MTTNTPTLASFHSKSREEPENITIAIREVLEVKAELEAEQWRREGEVVESAQVDVPVHA